MRRENLIEHDFGDRVVLALDRWLSGRGRVRASASERRGASGNGVGSEASPVSEAEEGASRAEERRGAAEDGVGSEASSVSGAEEGASRAEAPPGYPAAGVEDGALDQDARRRSGRLMRVNHAGEVAAQALYMGQGLVARREEVRRAFAEAAEEERDHLVWCRQRLGELGTGTSRLDPFWWAGSFAIGMAAGVAGDAASLGFVAETERQVVAHLGRHLERLPRSDHRSRVICRRMMEDERRHGTKAMEAGGRRPPLPVRLMMRCASRVMTTTAYRI